jgi:hypothetical protein
MFEISFLPASFSGGRPLVRLNFCKTVRSFARGMWGGGAGTINLSCLTYFLRMPVFVLPRLCMAAFAAGVSTALP